MGLALAVVVMLLHHDAAAGSGGTSGSLLTFVFKMDMSDTGVDPDASGKLDGALTREGTASRQQLKLSLVHLDPNTTYQLIAFVGDETNPRIVAQFTTDSKGAYAVTYVQKCPGPSIRNATPLPNALDPISHIRQLDIIKAGSVVLTAVIGSDLQADCISPSP